MVTLVEYLKAGTPIIYFKASDYTYALKYIREAVKDSAYVDSNNQLVQKNLRIWSVATGISSDAHPDILAQPSSPIFPLLELQKECETGTSTNVLVLLDFHKFITQPHIWRAMLSLVSLMANTCSSIIILSSEVVVPPEIEQYVAVLDYPLPSEKELIQLTQVTLQKNGIDCSGLDLTQMAQYGLGLSRVNYLNALYLLISSYQVTNESAREVLKAQKENLLAQSELLRALPADKGFSTIAGLDVMKNFTKRMISGGLGRGILILGVPGGGKTAFCSCLGAETGRPVLQMDFSRLMGGIVGETESKTAQALDMIDAMQPAILFVDEIEKGLAGTSGSNGDSGTSKRQGGLFLKWLSDHTSDVYVVATANDISQLPSEFLRAERWDTIFFVDLPDRAQSDCIFQMYKAKYNLQDDMSCTLEDIKDWTGAEIKSLCRIARGTGVTLKEASQMVVPMCKVAYQRLKALRDTASQYAVSANITSQTSDVQPFAGVRRI